ncbi:hypothetical protein LLEC1_00934, partial [Akanthomyces lecanii]
MAEFSAGMERVRRDLIQRAHTQRSDAMERGSVSHELAQTSNTVNAVQEGDRRTLGLAGFLSRPLRLVRQPVVVAGDSRRGLESPKSAQRNIPGNGLYEGLGSGATLAERAGLEITLPSPAVVVEANSQRQDDQTQLRLHDSHRSRPRRGFEEVRGHRKKLLFCVPWVNSGRVRVALMHCLTSVLFVLLLLAVYLGLSLTQHIQANELTILLLLIIVISTLYFCYHIVRLCLAVMHGDKPTAGSRGRPAMSSAEMLKTGYAMPRRPIRVILAQDEEAAGREEVANALTPPAYGFWRESVRLDPDRLYWQRNEAARRQESVPNMEPGHEHVARGGRRPPSYASDDGVSYVVDAIPTTAIASRQQMA